MQELSDIWCYYVDEDWTVPGGYRPSVVCAGVAGHRPVDGGGRPFAEGYTWGPTFEDALEQCRRVNARLGVDEELANAIVASSMWPNQRNKRKVLALMDKRDAAANQPAAAEVG